MAVIQFQDVTKVYPLPAGDVVALDGVSLDIDSGEFVSIMGPSGSGKSTLLNIMGSLDVPTSGDVYISGSRIGVMNDDELTLLRRDHIGFIFQHFNLIPLLSAVENVEYPMILRGRKTEARKRAVEVLAAVGLEESLYTHKPNELSGGQQQRVAIARALVNEPDFLLCDEPTGNLDTKTGTGIMNLLSRMNDGGTTVIVVTHDPRMTEYSNRTISIVDGRLA
ncbi:ABC transporter ATP-binding protein [Methanoculleus sp. FWC-SCC1]|uniref:ABC transporter ATP-binding protein n=1 Tax=Methanoculleus frigidifontis TaxID=2584085 RepID=A0ABT8MA36_9EURY|nr:ABC transporter ATP-binding protein [Methanoculleus sp. FWC-SCC1]MDN7024798.1 ABC transporter ATP-binding protein [Methanoculleus sp. FWC-SCC1]